MKGPRPGMAREPMPANQPKAPPSKAPLPAPTVAPSGAFVCFSWAKSFVPAFCGKSTDMSVFRNPSAFNRSTARSTPVESSKFQTLPYSFLPFHFSCSFLWKCSKQTGWRWRNCFKPPSIQGPDDTVITSICSNSATIPDLLKCEPNGALIEHFGVRGGKFNERTV